MTAGNALVRQKGFVVDIRSLQEAMEFAKLLAATDMVPEADHGKPGNILAKMQKGAEIGMPPMLAIGKLYMVKGRVGMEVMGMLALVEGSGLMEWKKIERLKEPEECCRVTVKRVGRDAHTVEFGKTEAVRAGLTTGRNKATYEAWDWRMYQNRALGFALQDEFADVLGGVVASTSLEDAGLLSGEGMAAELAGGPQPVAAMEAANEELAPIVAREMELIGMRPGQRLAKLTKFRGRLDDLRAEIAPQVEKARSGQAPTQSKPTQEEPQKVIDVRAEPPWPAALARPKPEPEPEPKRDICTACGTADYGNPDCDSCLDMRLAREEQPA